MTDHHVYKIGDQAVVTPSVGCGWVLPPDADTTHPRENTCGDRQTIAIVLGDADSTFDHKPHVCGQHGVAAHEAGGRLATILHPLPTDDRPANADNAPDAYDQALAALHAAATHEVAPGAPGWDTVKVPVWALRAVTRPLDDERIAALMARVLPPDHVEGPRSMVESHEALRELLGAHDTTGAEHLAAATSLGNALDSITAMCRAHPAWVEPECFSYDDVDTFIHRVLAQHPDLTIDTGDGDPGPRPVDMLFRGWVQDAGGGHVDLLIARETMDYPVLGAQVAVFPAAVADHIAGARRGLRLLFPGDGQFVVTVDHEVDAGEDVYPAERYQAVVAGDGVVLSERSWPEDGDDGDSDDGDGVAAPESEGPGGNREASHDDRCTTDLLTAAADAIAALAGDPFRTGEAPTHPLIDALRDRAEALARTGLVRELDPIPTRSTPMDLTTAIVTLAERLPDGRYGPELDQKTATVPADALRVALDAARSAEPMAVRREAAHLALSRSDVQPSQTVDLAGQLEAYLLHGVSRNEGAPTVSVTVGDPAGATVSTGPEGGARGDAR